MINCFQLLLSNSTCSATARIVLFWHKLLDPSEVGRCRLTVSKPVLKAPIVSALEAVCVEMLSNFAFNFKLRRYTSDWFPQFVFDPAYDYHPLWQTAAATAATAAQIAGN